MSCSQRWEQSGCWLARPVLFPLYAICLLRGFTFGSVGWRGAGSETVPLLKSAQQGAELRSAQQRAEPASPPQADAAACSREALLAESSEHTPPSVARPLT